MNKATVAAQKTMGFLRDVRTELQKSSWPTRGELMESTLVVILSVVVFTVFIAVSDFVISGTVGALVR